MYSILVIFFSHIGIDQYIDDIPHPDPKGTYPLYHICNRYEGISSIPVCGCSKGKISIPVSLGKGKVGFSIVIFESRDIISVTDMIERINPLCVRIFYSTDIDRGIMLIE